MHPPTALPARSLPVWGVNIGGGQAALPRAMGRGVRAEKGTLSASQWENHPAPAARTPTTKV